MTNVEVAQATTSINKRPMIYWSVICALYIVANFYASFIKSEETGLNLVFANSILPVIMQFFGVYGLLYIFSNKEVHKLLVFGTLAVATTVLFVNSDIALIINLATIAIIGVILLAYLMHWLLNRFFVELNSK